MRMFLAKRWYRIEINEKGKTLRFSQSKKKLESLYATFASRYGHLTRRPREVSKKANVFRMFLIVECIHIEECKKSEKIKKALPYHAFTFLPFIFIMQVPQSPCLQL